jgi:2-alkenal reductase
MLLALAAYTVPSRFVLPSAASPTAPNPTPPVVAGSPGGILSGIETALEGIYTQVNPSVVAIKTVRRQADVPLAPGIPNAPFFSPPQGQRPQRPFQFQQAEGSGFVWDISGHIITNNHVVSGADRISVTFSDGTTVAGRVVGTDPDSDLAVLKIATAAGALHPVRLADSGQVRVGQLAIAIGNPFGEQNTMTTGIVSALGRSLPVNDGAPQGPTYTIPDVIQTDAPINPGNSGGVLLDDQGRVIGVTSAIESTVNASSGIGFAIPSAIVKKVVPALIASGHYAHPWLGISGTSLTPELAKLMGLKENQRGALVADLTAAGPSARAGLRGSTRDVIIDGARQRIGGDVIVAFDGRPVKGFDDLVTYLVRNTTVGQTVALTVLRGGKEETLKVTLAARPARTAQ